MTSDAGVYVMPSSWGDGPLIIILYINDITILGASIEAVKQLKVNLVKHYEMSDLGKIESYLGVQIIQDQKNRCLCIDPLGYVKDILECFGMADANPHKTPLLAGAEEHLVKYTEQASDQEIKNYQSLIGSLLYIQIGTCLDISFAVSHLAQYAANPSPQHL